MATVAKCRVRCGGRLHRIELDDRGCMHFLDHANGWLRREAMLVKLGGTECRCWDVLERWRLACKSTMRLNLPSKLNDGARAALKTHKDRRVSRGNGQPPTFHGRMGQQAATRARGAMTSADYREGGSHWVENSGDCSVVVDWDVRFSLASATVVKVWHEKKPWSAKQVTWNLTVQPARFLVAQHRLGRHVSERGEDRVVLEILRDHRAGHKIPADALLVRAVRQGKGYDVYDCTAVLRPPEKGKGLRWRLTRWLD